MGNTWRRDGGAATGTAIAAVEPSLAAPGTAGAEEGGSSSRSGEVEAEDATATASETAGGTVGDTGNGSEAEVVDKESEGEDTPDDTEDGVADDKETGEEMAAADGVKDSVTTCTNVPVSKNVVVGGGYLNRVEGNADGNNGQCVAVDDGTTVVYYPNPHFVGDDYCNYITCDMERLCAVRRIRIRVIDDVLGSCPKAPVVGSLAPPTNEGDALVTTCASVSVSVDVTGRGGYLFHVEEDTSGRNGTCVTAIDARAVVHYNVMYYPDPGFMGKDHCDYIFCDVKGGCSVRWVNIRVEACTELTATGGPTFPSAGSSSVPFVPSDNPSSQSPGELLTHSFDDLLTALFVTPPTTPLSSPSFAELAVADSPAPETQEAAAKTEDTPDANFESEMSAGLDGEDKGEETADDILDGVVVTCMNVPASKDVVVDGGYLAPH